MLLAFDFAFAVRIQAAANVRLLQQQRLGGILLCVSSFGHAGAGHQAAQRRDGQLVEIPATDGRLHGFTPQKTMLELSAERATHPFRVESPESALDRSVWDPPGGTRHRRDAAPKKLLNGTTLRHSKTTSRREMLRIVVGVRLGRTDAHTLRGGGPIEEHREIDAALKVGLPDRRQFSTVLVEAAL